MKKEYEPLFTPWKIGNVEIKNRIVMTSMGGTSVFGWLEPNHFDNEAAEAEAEKRGCHSVHLDTMSWQAPDFYLKKGYKIISELQDIPQGKKKYHLIKDL